MATTPLQRIFLLYKLLHSLLLPKKLPSFFSLSTLYPTTTTTTTTTAALPEKPTAMDPTELKRIFQMFDRNGDGRISKKELTDSLQNLGIFIPDSELADIISKIDVNGDGFVDVDEFEALYLSILEGRGDGDDEEEDMREAFNVFDQNRDGFITVDELRSVLDSLGMNGRTVEECKTMITKVDVDGDGMVDYKEFRKMMKGGGFGSLTTTTDA